jgi:hypothetical protein
VGSRAKHEEEGDVEDTRYMQAWRWKQAVEKRIDQQVILMELEAQLTAGRVLLEQLVSEEREMGMATINWTAEPPVWEDIAATVPPVEVTP